MADKFSIDDIISEYSEKVENDLKTDESQENDEILNEDTNIDESIEKDNDISDIDSDGYDPIKATDFDDELASDHTNEKKRNEENAALINNLTKHKKGKAAKQSIPPVNRASLKDIKMGLTGKIIPKTEEFDKALIPDDATYEEKSSILSQHRKKKVDSFVLKTDEQESEPDSDDTNDKDKAGQTEFKKFDDAEKVFGSIRHVKSNLVLRLCVLLFTGIFSTFITVANDLELPLIKTFDRTITPAAYLFANTILGLISIAVCYNVLLAGIKSLFKKEADNDTIAAIGIFITVIAGIINLFDPESIRDNVYHVYISVAIVGLKGELAVSGDEWMIDYVYAQLASLFQPYPPTSFPEVFMCKGGMKLGTFDSFRRTCTFDIVYDRSDLSFSQLYFNLFINLAGQKRENRVKLRIDKESYFELYEQSEEL